VGAAVTGLCVGAAVAGSDKMTLGVSEALVGAGVTLVVGAAVATTGFTVGAGVTGFWVGSSVAGSDKVTMGVSEALVGAGVTLVVGAAVTARVGAFVGESVTATVGEGVVGAGAGANPNKLLKRLPKS